MDASRLQYRLSWRGPDWPASRPIAARLFRHPLVAESFARRLRAMGATILAVEEREMIVTPWRPSAIGDVR